MSLSEFDLIYRYFSSLGRGEAVDLSVGDDCAILKLEAGERLATSVDTMVSGVHFPEDSFPEDIGFRTVSAATSDLAAMGARPLGMTIALTLPEADELWLNAFSQGLAAAVSEYALPLVGGDTTRGPLTITVQAQGVSIISSIVKDWPEPDHSTANIQVISDLLQRLTVIVKQQGQNRDGDQPFDPHPIPV